MELFRVQNLYELFLSGNTQKPDLGFAKHVTNFIFFLLDSTVHNIYDTIARLHNQQMYDTSVVIAIEWCSSVSTGWPAL